LQRMNTFKRLSTCLNAQTFHRSRAATFGKVHRQSAFQLALETHGMMEIHQRNTSTSSSSIHNLTTQIASELNKISGFDVVEQIKMEIQTLDREIQQARKDVAAARMAYDDLLTRRKNNAREMNSLLQNKHAWTPADLERFTKVFQDEHVLESSEEAGKATLNSQTTRLDELFMGMLDKQRSLYAAEQGASDKVRVGSTYWTMLLMGVQLASFLAVYGFLEPRRRRLLQQQLDDLKNEVKSGHSSSLMETEGRIAQQLATFQKPTVETIYKNVQETEQETEPETLKERLTKLYYRYKAPTTLDSREVEALATGALITACIVYTLKFINQ
jgi:sensitive to high expression protein 9